jgi:hypothetical protein
MWPLRGAQVVAEPAAATFVDDLLAGSTSDTLRDLYGLDRLAAATISSG